MGDKKPKPKLLTVEQATSNLKKERASQAKKYKNESILHMLGRTFNPFGTEEFDDQVRVSSLETQLRAAKLNARHTAGDTSNVNPINGPIAETHKKAGK